MNDPSFHDQLEGVRKRAARERSVITKLSYHDGLLTCELRKRRDVERDLQEERMDCYQFGKVGRGAQGELI